MELRFMNQNQEKTFWQTVTCESLWTKPWFLAGAQKMNGGRDSTRFHISNKILRDFCMASLGARSLQVFLHGWRGCWRLGLHRVPWTRLGQLDYYPLDPIAGEFYTNSFRRPGWWIYETANIMEYLTNPQGILPMNRKSELKSHGLQQDPEFEKRFQTESWDFMMRIIARYW